MTGHHAGVTRRSFGILLGAFALVTGCRVEAAASGPALWSVRKGKATVYLFGQMPVRTDTVWLTREIEAAFAVSDVLWLENPDFTQTSPQVMEAVNALNRSVAPEPAYTVLQQLAPRDAQRLRNVLAEEGMQPEALAGRPRGDVRLLLSSIADRRTGADFKAIPEAVFRGRALATGKPVRTEWRDLLDVVTWSTDLPETVQLDLVRMALDEIDGVKGFPAELASWASGELQVQVATARARVRDYPELTRRLGAQRDAGWVRKTRSMLTEAKTQFVCIGIAHLVEPGGVLELLRKEGLRVEGGPHT